MYLLDGWMDWDDTEYMRVIRLALCYLYFMLWMGQRVVWFGLARRGLYNTVGNLIELGAYNCDEGCG